MRVIGFHNPDEEYGAFSNWYPSKFVVDGICFTSMEQFMMYRKAVWFQDHEIAEKILATEDAARIKELGRMVAGYEDLIWSGIRQMVVYEGLIKKFSQNSELCEQLLNTGDAMLSKTGSGELDLRWTIQNGLIRPSGEVKICLDTR